jgi:hypothetical protein
MAIDVPSVVVDAVVSLAVGSVGAAIVGALIKRRVESALDIWRSRRNLDERSVAELLGPVYIQLVRTKRAFERWDGKNLFLEGQVIRAGNVAIRDLLLSKPHLIPPELRQAASDLILHYDVWLEEFDRQRGRPEAAGPDFVFAGPQGYPFPTVAEAEFKLSFEDHWKRVYADARDKAAAP